MEFAGLIRVLVAFAFVVGLMFGTAWLVRKLGLDKRLRAFQNKDGQSVQIEDICYLDPKRRVVTLARGSKKHLLLLGPHGDIVIEQFEGNEERSEGDVDDA